MKIKRFRDAIYTQLHIDASALPLNQLSGHSLTSYLLNLAQLSSSLSLCFSSFFYVILTIVWYWPHSPFHCCCLCVMINAGLDQRFPFVGVSMGFCVFLSVFFLILYLKKNAEEAQFVFVIVFLFLFYFFVYALFFQLLFLTVIVGHFVALTGHSLALQKLAYSSYSLRNFFKQLLVNFKWVCGRLS